MSTTPVLEENRARHMGTGSAVDTLLYQYRESIVNALDIEIAALKSHPNPLTLRSNPLQPTSTVSEAILDIEEDYSKKSNEEISRLIEEENSARTAHEEKLQLIQREYDELLQQFLDTLDAKIPEFKKASDNDKYQQGSQAMDADVKTANVESAFKGSVRYSVSSFATSDLKMEDNANHYDDRSEYSQSTYRSHKQSSMHSDSLAPYSKHVLAQASKIMKESLRR